MVLRVLIDAKGPEQLHLKPPPTPLLMGPEAHLSSAQSCKFCSKLRCRIVVFSLARVMTVPALWILPVYLGLLHTAGWGESLLSTTFL